MQRREIGRMCGFVVLNRMVGEVSLHRRHLNKN